MGMMQLFDSLPPASPEQLIGRAWRGRVVRTGRFLDLPDMFMIQPARLLGFKWGKRYLTPYIGDPLCYTFFDRVHIPQPLLPRSSLCDDGIRPLTVARLLRCARRWD